MADEPTLAPLLVEAALAGRVRADVFPQAVRPDLDFVLVGFSPPGGAPTIARYLCLGPEGREVVTGHPERLTRRLLPVSKDERLEVASLYLEVSRPLEGHVRLYRSESDRASARRRVFEVDEHFKTEERLAAMRWAEAIDGGSETALRAVIAARPRQADATRLDWLRLLPTSALEWHEHEALAARRRSLGAFDERWLVQWWTDETPTAGLVALGGAVGRFQRVRDTDWSARWASPKGAYALVVPDDPLVFRPDIGLGDLWALTRDGYTVRGRDVPSRGDVWMADNPVVLDARTHLLAVDAQGHVVRRQRWEPSDWCFVDARERERPGVEPTPERVTVFARWFAAPENPHVDGDCVYALLEVDRALEACELRFTPGGIEETRTRFGA